MKKSAYKTLAEAIASGVGLKALKVPTGRVDCRRLTIDEIKDHIKEEFGKVLSAEDVDAKEEPRGWGDADLEKEIEWAKTLKLESFFEDKKKEK
jgi:hypothetical protein